MRSIIEALRGSMFSPGETQPKWKLLAVTFHGWHGQMLRSLMLRREEQERHRRNTQRIEAWLLRRRTQMAQVKPRQELRQLIDENVNSRGPLKFLKNHVQEPPRYSPRATQDLCESPYSLSSRSWHRRSNSMNSRQNARLPPLTARAAQPERDEKGDLEEAVKSEKRGSAQAMDDMHHGFLSVDGVDSTGLDENDICEIPGHGHMVLEGADTIHKCIAPATASIPWSLVVKTVS